MDAILRVERIWTTDKATVGALYDHEGNKICWTLEDPIRTKKEAGRTAIPSGLYPLVIGWSNRFGMPMPRVCNVPFYEGILIHKGNTVEHTEGCILIGHQKDENAGTIWESQSAFEKFFPFLRKLTEKAKVFLQVDGGYKPSEWTS